jgi:hypothetical protein
MGRKNNVNPDFYKTAGRERPGQDVDQEINRLKYTQALADEEYRFRQAREEQEGGSKFIPESEPDRSAAADTENENLQTPDRADPSSDS